MRNPFDARIKPSEITSESTYLSRRALLAGAVAVGLSPSIMAPAEAATIPAGGDHAPAPTKWPDSATDKLNTYEDATHL